MVFAEMLLIYPDWKLAFILHADSSDKKLGAFIIHNNKSIAFSSRIFSKPQRNYTMTEKDSLSILEFLKQFQGILFGYEINVFLDHTNLVYAATLSESQRVIR